jgi:hypothetical protein
MSSAKARSGLAALASKPRASRRGLPRRSGRFAVTWSSELRITKVGRSRLKSHAASSHTGHGGGPELPAVTRPRLAARRPDVLKPSAVYPAVRRAVING